MRVAVRGDLGEVEKLYAEFNQVAELKIHNKQPELKIHNKHINYVE